MQLGSQASLLVLSYNACNGLSFLYRNTIKSKSENSSLISYYNNRNDFNRLIIVILVK